MSDDTLEIPTEPSCDEWAALAALAALDVALSADEVDRLVSHVASCDACRQRLRDYAYVSQLLPLAVPLAEPAPRLRTMIMTAARESRVASPPAPILPIQWQKWLTPLLGLACVLLAAWSLSLNQELWAIRDQQAANRALIMAAFGNDDAHEYALRSTEVAPAALGRLFVSPSHPAVVLYVKQLPPAPPGYIYQLWLSSGTHSTQVASFQVDAHGRSWVIARPPDPFTQLSMASVILAPDGGTPAPETPPVLVLAKELSS